MSQAIWDLCLPRVILVQTFLWVINLSSHRRILLHFFSAFTPVWLALRTSIKPDMLDVAFLIGVNVAIWWTNPMNSVVVEEAWILKSEDYIYIDIMLQFVFGAIAGCMVAFIMSLIVFIAITIPVFLFNPPILAVRFICMIGIWNNISTFFTGGMFDNNHSSMSSSLSRRLSIFRFGLTVGASLFFIQGGFFSSNISYTCLKIGQVWMGEVASFVSSAAQTVKLT